MSQQEHLGKRSEVLSLFPTFVWETQLAPKVWCPLNGRIKDHLHALIPDLEVGQSWQSSHDLHKLTEFEELAHRIKTTAATSRLRPAGQPSAHLAEGTLPMPIPTAILVASTMCKPRQGPIP